MAYEELGLIEVVARDGCEANQASIVTFVFASRGRMSSDQSTALVPLTDLLEVMYNRQHFHSEVTFRHHTLGSTVATKESNPKGS